MYMLKLTGRTGSRRFDRRGAHVPRRVVRRCEPAVFREQLSRGTRKLARVAAGPADVQTHDPLRSNDFSVRFSFFRIYIYRGEGAVNHLECMKNNMSDRTARRSRAQFRMGIGCDRWLRSEEHVFRTEGNVTVILVG